MSSLRSAGIELTETSILRLQVARNQIRLDDDPLNLAYLERARKWYYLIDLGALAKLLEAPKTICSGPCTGSSAGR